VQSWRGEEEFFGVKVKVVLTVVPSPFDLDSGRDLVESIPRAYPVSIGGSRTVKQFSWGIVQGWPRVP